MNHVPQHNFGPGPRKWWNTQNKVATRCPCGAAGRRMTRADVYSSHLQTIRETAGAEDAPDVCPIALTRAGDRIRLAFAHHADPVLGAQLAASCSFPAVSLAVAIVNLQESVGLHQDFTSRTYCDEVGPLGGLPGSRLSMRMRLRAGPRLPPLRTVHGVRLARGAAGPAAIPALIFLKAGVRDACAALRVDARPSVRRARCTFLRLHALTHSGRCACHWRRAACSGVHVAAITIRRGLPGACAELTNGRAVVFTGVVILGQGNSRTTRAAMPLDVGPAAVHALREPGQRVWLRITHGS